MKSWSAKKIEDNWRVKIYFDTNILLYLCEKNYESLNNTLSFFLDKDIFVDLVCSEYTLFEFVDNRRKKHYRNALYSLGLIKDRNNFIILLNRYLIKFGLTLDRKGHYPFTWSDFHILNIKDNSYNAHSENIERIVENEIESLKRNYNVNYVEYIFNSSLFRPTKDLCLKSRVSRQDCIMTTSAVYPNDSGLVKDAIIWTSDEDYFKAFYECNNLEVVFNNCVPKVEFIKKLSLGEQGSDFINLTKPLSFNKISAFMSSKILHYLKLKNISCFIGTTAKPTRIKNVVYIKLSNKVNISFNKIYLTIISKKLEFIINSKAIDSIWMDGAVLDDESYKKTKIGDVLSVNWEFTDNHLSDSADIIECLRETGHLVFLTPI